ncbi:HAD-like protein [Coprinopsis marcescibilis]|uniref:Mitochondrial import inner membrane translocase subunit TIM50 n=1 Tax=Coprinopsis marcescibilis TaxID=230819 RepID=A0A5C3KGY7_COPMA|nr:HAD-like protein [Coprinopsis marcescibilis]
MMSSSALMFNVVARSVASSRRHIVPGVRWVSQVPPNAPKGQKSDPKTPSETDTGKAPEGIASSSSDPLAAGSSKIPSLDFSPAEEAEEKTERTGARSSRDNTMSTEKRRKGMGRVMMALFAGGMLGYGVYLGRDWEEDELKAKKLNLETAPSTRWGRTTERFGDIFDYFNKPAWPELLPPPYPPPHGKPYTLVLSLDDLLITSTWDRQHGWRTAKRPGVDYFLAYISQFFEVVVFTAQPSYTAAPILDKLDRYNFFVVHRLFREHTRSLNGKIVKDLSYLNRDPSKVIMLDTDPEHICLQPENAVLVPKWKGDPKDKGLIAMIPFLESIGIYKPEDIRPILKAYEGKEIPIEYAKTEAEAKARHVERWKAQQPGVSVSVMSSLFGLSNNPQTPRGVAPPTYLEQKRREAQLQYQDEQKYLAENKGQLEKLLEQEQAAMAAQVPNNLWEAFGAMSKPPPAPDAGAAAPTESTPAPKAATSLKG